MFQLCNFKTQHHCKYCTRKRIKNKINLKLKPFEINKITLEKNKLGIEIYNIIQYEITKRLYVCTTM